MEIFLTNNEKKTGKWILCQLFFVTLSRFIVSSAN